MILFWSDVCFASWSELFWVSKTTTHPHTLRSDGLIGQGSAVLMQNHCIFTPSLYINMAQTVVVLSSCSLHVHMSTETRAIPINIITCTKHWLYDMLCYVLDMAESRKRVRWCWLWYLKYGRQSPKEFKRYFNNFKKARDHNNLSGKYVPSAR